MLLTDTRLVSYRRHFTYILTLHSLLCLLVLTFSAIQSRDESTQNHFFIKAVLLQFVISCWKQVTDVHILYAWPSVKVLGTLYQRKRYSPRFRFGSTGNKMECSSPASFPERPFWTSRFVQTSTSQSDFWHYASKNGFLMVLNQLIAIIVWRWWVWFPFEDFLKAM